MTRQMSGRKFDPTLILAVADRCRFGCPRVLLCSPLQRFRPFPTTFWLTCPWLVRRIGAVESQGGVRELEQWLELRARREWFQYDLAHRRLRILMLNDAQRAFLRTYRPRVYDRLRSGGTGGTERRGSEVNVKCVHLQVASWLALRRHPGVEWLRQKGLNGDCGGVLRGLCEGWNDKGGCQTHVERPL